MAIPTNEQILARLNQTKGTSVPVSSIPPAKKKEDTTVKKSSNNLLSIPGKVIDFYKPLASDVGNVFKDIGRGLASFGVSTIEAAPRVAAGIGQLLPGKNPDAEKVANAEYTYHVPVLGDIESIQTKAIRNMKQGEKLGPALGKATVDALLNEPAGLAFKPVFAAGGLLFKEFGKKGLEPLASEALKHETPEAFESAVKGLRDLQAKGSPLLPEQTKILDAIKNGGKDFNLSNFYTKVKEGAVREAAAKATKATKSEIPPQTAEQIPTQIEAPSAKGKLPRPAQVAAIPESTAPKVSSLADDTSKIVKSQDLNLEHLNISDDAKALIEREFKDLGDDISAKVGKPLTHKEIVQTAEESSRILTRAVGRETTEDWEKALLNLRQKIAAQAQDGKVTKEFLDDLKVLKTQGTDIARRLNSFAIGADPRAMTSKRAILDAVMKVNDNLDEIFKAAQGVDFNDPKQAVEFYRKFVTAKAEDWVDLLRYNSMLSSPKTHLINIFSNAINSTLTPALTKAMRGGFDFLSSKLTGAQRKHLAGEAGAYLKGYVKSVQNASKAFAGVWKGQRDFTNLDYRSIPLATKGPAAKIEKFLSVPTKVLEGADQFFMELVTGGEKAALEFRKAAGVPVKNIDAQAEETAKYLLYRSERKSQGQGHVLDAMDTLTNIVTRLRSSENPLVRIVSKLTFPFIATPTNIMKQGVEFSPLGFATIPGAKDKTAQAIKAAVGTSVAMAGGLLIASNRMTWGEPQSTADRNAFRAAGMQPYSIKLGDRWYSYQKLPPLLAFPLSMVAVVNQAVRDKKIDDGTADVVLSAFAKYADFFADQSYFKSMGDLWSAINGDEYAISRLIGNYPQQFIPYRALTGWLARLTDPNQRQIAPGSNFIEKQVQLLMQQYPGLSQLTAPRLGPTGEPVPNRERVLNAFSPVQTQQQAPEQAADYETALDLKSRIRNQTSMSASITSQAQALVEQARKMTKEEGNAFLAEQTKGNDQLKSKVKSVIADQKKNFTYTEKLISSLGVTNGERANYIVSQVNKLGSKEEKLKYLNGLKDKGLISSTVQEQIKKLLSSTKASE